MSTLYLRIPPKHAATGVDGELSYALCAPGGAILRQGFSTLAQLAGTIATSDLVLLIAAADVTLLVVSVPVMPEAKLKMALPNLVEDRLMCDPADCVFLLGAYSRDETQEKAKNNLQAKSPVSSRDRQDTGSGMHKRTVAVVQRSWLQHLSAALFALGARQIKAYPEQLYLPCQDGQVSARLRSDKPDTYIDLALRFDRERGIGLLMPQQQDATNCLSTICLLVPGGPVALQLSEQLMTEYQRVLQAHPEWAARLSLQTADWQGMLQSGKGVSLNLMAGLNVARASRMQWQLWRWPLGLAVGILLVNLTGLNIEYWGLKREEQALKHQMTQTYRSSFPKESIVPFPLEQMRKNVDLAQRRAGQPGADDFTLMLSEFGSAWGTLAADSPVGGVPKIVAIDYKKQGLLVKIKGTLNQERLRQLLASGGLSLTKINSESWQVRTDK